MTWTYKISTGEFSNGAQTFRGYAGAFGQGQNDPGFCHVADSGPIPVGRYAMGTPMDSIRLGPMAVPLAPAPGTETFGRTGFFIHGDNISAPGHGSDGCIVLAISARGVITNSGDNDLEVIA